MVASSNMTEVDAEIYWETTIGWKESGRLGEFSINKGDRPVCYRYRSSETGYQSRARVLPRASSFPRDSCRALPRPWSVERGVSACDRVRFHVSALRLAALCAPCESLESLGSSGGGLAANQSREAEKREADRWPIWLTSLLFQEADHPPIKDQEARASGGGSSANRAVESAIPSSGSV
eukprot:IDg7060t1